MRCKRVEVGWCELAGLSDIDGTNRCFSIWSSPVRMIVALLLETHPVTGSIQPLIRDQMVEKIR